jgi:hypothetical protein
MGGRSVSVGVGAPYPPLPRLPPLLLEGMQRLVLLKGG